MLKSGLKHVLYKLFYSEGIQKIGIGLVAEYLKRRTNMLHIWRVICYYRHMEIKKNSIRFVRE
jgi:hypothetical protein